MIQANDVVLHRPSGETWLVAGVHKDGKTLIPCGWPLTIANVSDCDLIEKHIGPQAQDARDFLKREGFISYIEDAEVNKDGDEQ